METPEGNFEGDWPGNQRGPGIRRPSSPAKILGSLTIPGQPEQVAAARAFIARTLSDHRVRTDTDAAALLASEIVTNAIQHTKSGIDGGTVTIVMIGVPRGILIEVIDDGSAGTPVVKGDLYAAEGHGLFLVQHLAAQWGYHRDPAGTTVWFQLPASGGPWQAAERADPHPGRLDRDDPHPPGAGPRHARPSQLWAAAIRPATAPA
jgi:anti-sigma regulatory factor (Ser/Thr protein kinase)